MKSDVSKLPKTLRSTISERDDTVAEKQFNTVNQLQKDYFITKMHLDWTSACVVVLELRQLSISDCISGGCLDDSVIILRHEKPYRAYNAAIDILVLPLSSQAQPLHVDFPFARFHSTIPYTRPKSQHHYT
jgi:hypothetical protein